MGGPVGCVAKQNLCQVDNNGLERKQLRILLACAQCYKDTYRVTTSEKGSQVPIVLFGSILSRDLVSLSQKIKK